MIDKMELALSFFYMSKLLTAFQTTTIKECTCVPLGPCMINHTLNIFSAYCDAWGPAPLSLLGREGEESELKLLSKIDILMWTTGPQPIVVFYNNTSTFQPLPKPVAVEMQGTWTSRMPASLTIQYKCCLFSFTTIVNRHVSGLRPILHCSLLSPPLCALQEWELLFLILHLLLLGLLIYKPSRVEPKPFLQQSFLGAKWENPLLK